MNETRIVLLGKSGCGKSRLGNVLLGASLFEVKVSPNSVIECQEKTHTKNEKSTTVIETPGFFDVSMSEEERKREIVKYMIMCSPGVHAFLFVLEIARFTDLERNLFEQILECFSEEALRHAVVVFTHGNKLPYGKSIEEFAGENKHLRNLVKKCGCRCFVVDSKNWNEGYGYECPLSTLSNTINTIKAIQGVYTNELLQNVGEQKKDKGITEKLLNEFDGVAPKAALGIIFGAKKYEPKAVVDGSAEEVSGCG